MAIVPALIERIRWGRMRETVVTDAHITNAVRKAEAECAPRATLLKEQIKVTSREEADVRRERKAAAEVIPPPAERSKLPLGIAFVVGTYSLVMGTNYAALGAVPIPGWLQVVLAALLGVLSLTAGWARYASRSGAGGNDQDLHHYISTALLTLAVVASAFLGYARMTDLFTETAAGVELNAAAERVLRAVTVVFVFVAIAAEIATAFAAEKVLLLGGPVIRVARLRRREHALGMALAGLKAELETLKQKPVLVEADLRARQAVLYREREGIETIRRIVPVEASGTGGGGAETIPATVIALPPARRRRMPNPLKRTMISAAIVAAIIAAAFFLYLFAAPAAHAETLGALHIVLLDTSGSIPHRQFERYVVAVEAEIKALPETGRLVVFQIAERSFGLEPLFEIQAPVLDPYWNRTGAQARAWKRETVERWKAVRSTLAPSARCSDVLGAIKRAQLDLADSRAAEKQLTIFSDLRHADCEGALNLERSVGDIMVVLASMQARALLPDLAGVRVRAHGVHTEGFSAEQWGRLRAFWSAFFERSRADLVAYSPNFERNGR